MTAVEKIQNAYEVGKPVFDKLFNKSSKEIKEIVRKLIGDNERYEYLLSDSSTVIKTLHNDEPHEISIEFYNLLIINAFGIYYRSEYGDSKATILKFTEFIKID